MYATGGASANETILSIAADIFGCPIAKNVEYKPGVGWVGAHWNACSVGAAYKARWGYERHVAPEGSKVLPFDEVISRCREARRETRKGQDSKGGLGDNDVEEGVKIVAVPGEGAAAYAQCGEWWKSMEKRALGDKELK